MNYGRCAPGLLTELQTYNDVEQAYTSNVIEGNSLTLRKTAEVIEHGITVGGRKLRDYLKAVDHYDAVQRMRAQSAHDTPIGELNVRSHFQCKYSALHMDTAVHGKFGAYVCHIWGLCLSHRRRRIGNGRNQSRNEVPVGHWGMARQAALGLRRDQSTAEWRGLLSRVGIYVSDTSHALADGIVRLNVPFSIALTFMS